MIDGGDRIDQLTNEFGERLAREAKSDAEYLEALLMAQEILDDAIGAAKEMIDG